MNLLAEDENFKIIGEYEKAILINKKNNSHIVIGDFYGDPLVAIIDKNKKFCVIGGCGLIIYYLCTPYEMYSYEKTTPQWKEKFREGEEVWIEEIKQIDNRIIEVKTEEMKVPVLIDAFTGQIQ